MEQTAAVEIDKAAEFRQSAEKIVKQRVGPGVVVLAPEMRVAYMNRQGWEFVARIRSAEAGPSAEGGVPGVLATLYGEVQAKVRHRIQANGSGSPEEQEVTMLAGAPDQPVLLRAFGVSASDAESAVLVVVLLEEVGRRRPRVPEGVRERFRLTEREQSVVERLAQGLTNKEIAAVLGISEPTVKEHVKRIMQKTRSKNRTGILVHLMSLLDRAS